MILSSALISYQNESCKHPQEKPFENINSTFIRSSVIANHVNLSPSTLWSYNHEQVGKLQHCIFGSIDKPSNIQSVIKDNKQIHPSHAVDLLSFIPDLMV